MPIVYLEPTDLSAAQVGRVLGLLNRASSAEQLARDIEFPDELDIGVRLGQRLLDARAALGGNFSDIRQVRSVRLIGPERFTEICVAALGIHPRTWVELFFGAAPLGTEAEDRLTLTLELSPRPAWLGQPRTLFASVRGKSGEPRAGVPVTLHTDFGRLSHAYGFTVSEGAAVTALTGADGRVEVRLFTPPDEPLAAEQRAALLVALGRLDANAPHPLALEQDFLALADEYALDRNYALRRAIDLYTREYRNALVDSLNPGRWRLSWPTQTGVVRADAHPPEGGGTSLTHAVLAVAWLNWVGPWVEFLGDAMRRDSGLDAIFTGAQGPGVIGSLVGTAASFLAAQPGLSREWLGKKIIDASVRDFIGKSAGQLAPEEQSAAIAQLEFGAQEVRPGGLGAYKVVTGNSSELSTRIDGVGVLANANLGELARVETAVDAKADQVNQQALEVEAARQQVLQQSGQIDASVVKFNSQFNQFTVDYNDFNLKRTTFTSTLGGLQTELSGVKLDVANLGRLQLPRDAPKGPKG